MDKSKWIAIEERLPEVNVPVLVCGKALCSDKIHVVSVASRGEWKSNNPSWSSAGRWYTAWIGGYECEWDMDAITHWQPLPDLPEE